MYITDIFDREDLRVLINQVNVGVVVSDPKQQDNPMIYVNKTFLKMTGYSLEEVIGKNCRFLQGKDTSQSTVSAIRVALKEKTQTSVTIKNYRKDGSAFWNRLNITPIFDDKGDINYFMGVQEDITDFYNENLAKTEHIRELELKIKRFERELNKNL